MSTVVTPVTPTAGIQPPTPTGYIAGQNGVLSYAQFQATTFASYAEQFYAQMAWSKNPILWPLYVGLGCPYQNGTQLPSGAARSAICAAAVAAGIVIDEEIDYLGMDAYTMMYAREQFGNTWVPPGLQGTTGVGPYGNPPYTGAVPAGCIKVSTLLSDYPPNAAANPPVPTPPPTTLAPNPVGARIIAQYPQQPNFVGDVFRCAVANDGYALGSTYTGTVGSFSGTWTKEALEMGMMIAWVKTA